MNKIKLSIIIPMYKVEKYIEKCLLSTQNQDVDKNEYEIIVVNDGSPDKSFAIAEKLASKYGNIHVFSKENGGLSSSRNFGISKAQGEYIFFLDSDDWITENCLGVLSAKLKSETPDVLCICAANTDGTNYKRRFEFKDTTPISGAELLMKGWYIPCAPFYIVKNEFLRKYDLRFYEGILHEDSEYMPRMLYFAHRVSFLNQIIYWVYQNPNSITRTVNPQKSYDLVEVVCEHLSEFCNETAAPEHKYIYHKMISMYINNALANILKSNKDEQRKLNKCLYTHRHLFSHLHESPLLKNRIEGVLFSLFIRQYVFIYKVMKSI